MSFKAEIMNHPLRSTIWIGVVFGLMLAYTDWAFGDRSELLATILRGVIVGVSVGGPIIVVVGRWRVRREND